MRRTRSEGHEKQRHVLTNERYVGDALLQKNITTFEYPPRKIRNDGSQPQYYVENCLPAIFTREERAAILALMEQRGIKGRKTGGHPLSKLLRCSECGHSYRRIVTQTDVLWRCAYRSSGKTDCTIYTVREEDVCQAFITAIGKLRTSSESILVPLIERLEAMQSNHPAIIPREKFDRVQMELARRGSLKKKKQTGVKTELGKYSSKYALTELLICGKCGTAYRRSVWSKNGKKKAVWRCISRMEYGTKYCSDSPTIEETVIHRAVVEAIREVANDGGCQLAIKNLQTHIRMYYGGNDDNSLAADELRLNQLIAEVMNRAKQIDAASDEFLALSQEIAETKKRIAEKKAQQMTAHANEARMNEVLGTLDGRVLFRMTKQKRRLKNAREFSHIRQGVRF